MYHFCIVKKNGLNLLLRNHFCFAVLRPGTEPWDYEAVSRNLPPIIFALVLSSRGFGSRQILTKFSDKV